MGYLLALFLVLVANLATLSAAPIQVDRQGDQHYFTDGLRKFYSIGVNCVLVNDDPGQIKGDPYYNQSHREIDWVKEVVSRFHQWGFNTVGAFSSKSLHKELLYTHSIYFGNYDASAPHMLADVWSKEYVDTLDKYAKDECESRKNDPNLLGYFISNEIKVFGDLPWKPHQNSLLDIYLRLPSESPGYQRVVQFINKTAHLDSDKQKDLWAAIVMRQYMKLCVEAIKRYDSTHLILGTRFAAVPPDEVVEAVAAYSDVISFNLYLEEFSHLDRWHKLTGKPIMITEFSWRPTKNKSGNPNTKGPDVTVATDADRASNYQGYLTKIMERPWIIGIQWFQYFDEPASGRSKDGYGEDSAYGIVSVNNEIYEELAKAMALANKMWQESLSR